MNFKPMLSPSNDPMKDPSFFAGLRYPLLCSPKLDGIRCIVKGGQCLSRTLLPLPSKQIQALFKDCINLDGEIIIGNETDADVYNRTQSHVMSVNKIADVADIKFRVFDTTDLLLCDDRFDIRLDVVKKLIYSTRGTEWPSYKNVSFIQHTLCHSEEQLLAYEAAMLEQGYEGIMMRDPAGRYKHGRGTFKEGLIYKLKRFQDDEATVIGFQQQMKNNNVEETDALGYSKRSTAKEGLIPVQTLGKFVVKYGDLELEIAPGILTAANRKEIWDNADKYVGKILKFRHFAYGVKDKPRFPRFVGWRTKEDM